VGIVTTIGTAVNPDILGSHVAVRATLRCGACAECAARRPRACLRPRRLGLSAWGGYADYVAIPESSLVPIPKGVPFPDAAVIFRHVPTAFHLLDCKANIADGESVLIMGASGGLGSAGIQVAKLRGARVIAGAGTDVGLTLARELGADETVNYRSENLEGRVLELTHGNGVDIVFENVGASGLFEAAFRSLAHGGRLVTAGAHAGGDVHIDVKRLYRKKLSLLGGSGAGAADIQATIDGVNRGAFRAGIARILPLSQVWEAHRLVEERLVTGKVVMVPDRIFS
jgi:NADPH:quinone reductase-like Zn-dependent oxidoreductase